MNIKEVLNGALQLNGDDKKYVVAVENNKIITTVKWMDAIFFTPNSVTDEIKEFKFIAKLNDDNTWSEIDQSKTIKKSAGLGRMSLNYSAFKGKEISFNKTIAIGKNRGDNSIGIIKSEFNSEEYKKPVVDYLTKCGYKKTKKGFLNALFDKK